MFRNFIKVGLVLVIVAAFSGGGLRADQAAGQKPGVTRTVLKQQDLPMPGGYAAALVRVDLPPGAREGRHQHPGTLVALVEAGTITLEVEGKPTDYKTGETFAVEPGKIHEGMNKGTVPVRLTASFVFPKDKPMTIQVP
jgi:quercetin dioxygenase-like cupin family protein